MSIPRKNIHTSKWLQATNTHSRKDDADPPDALATHPRAGLPQGAQSTTPGHTATAALHRPFNSCSRRQNRGKTTVRLELRTEWWRCEKPALNILANLENSAVATGLEKVSFLPNSKKGNAKECSNYHKIALISHASKVMLKILQARFQQYVNHELPDVQAGFRKGRGTRDQIANIHWIVEKGIEFQ